MGVGAASLRTHWDKGDATKAIERGGFLHRHHDEVFRDTTDRLMPQWRLHRRLLNRSPLSHED